jgi:hypothetical protein
MQGWSAFLSAQAGASAALLGLVFVSLSISLPRITASKHLPNRALESLIVLLLGLIAASLGLAPGQAAGAFGVELLAIVSLVWAAVSWLHRASHRTIPAEYRRRGRAALLLAQGVMAIWWIAALALSLFGARAAGLLAPAFLLGYVLAMVDAWVLLVEVNR